MDDCAFSPLWAYADSLWAGEGYDYHNSDADYWLIRMSGLNFGIFADMLGTDSFVNPYRGMIFGQTSRAPQAHPQAMWALWDSFRIHEARNLCPCLPTVSSRRATLLTFMRCICRRAT